jgi:hypothetical protein
MIPRWLVLLPLAYVSVAAQTATLNLSTDLVRLGIASSNMAPNQATLDSGPLLTAGVKYASTHQINRVIADRGTYYFLTGDPINSTTHVLLAGITASIDIDLQGSDLNFANPGKTGLFLSNLSNITLENFTVDYTQQRYTQLLVTSVNGAARQVQYTVQPGWQTPTTLSNLSASVSSGTPETDVYVFRSGQPWIGFTQMRVATPYTDTQLTFASTVPTATVGAIRPGDVIVLNLRAGGNGILTSGLNSCALRNIKIYAGLVGLRSVSSASTLLEHIEVMPRPSTDRLVSTMADGISLSQPGANNTVRLCRSIRTCDDGFSPNTFVYGSFRSAQGTRAVQIQGDTSTALNTGLSLPNGSNVAFERASDGTIVATATLVSQATATAIGGLPQAILTFDRDLPDLTGTFVYGTDASWRGGNLLLERNTVQQQGWARGMSLWGLMNTTVFGNYIKRSSMAGIALMHQLRVGDWIVPPVVNLTVANNVIDGTITGPDTHTLIEVAAIQAIATSDTQTPYTTKPDQSISITANFIADPSRTAIWLQNTSSGLVDTNYLLNPNNAPNAALAFPAFATQEQQPLVAQSNDNVTLGRNTVDVSSRHAFVTNQNFLELAAYAPGSTIRLNAYNLGGLATPSISLTDADGRSTALTIVATSAHAIDVQLPAAAGFGGAVVTVTAGTQSYFGTLFIDDQDNVAAINQATYLVSASTTTLPADGGTIPVLVITPSGNTFAVTASDSFVTVPSSGSGTSIVNVAIGKNLGAARTTTVEIAGQPITFTQSGTSDPSITTQPQSQTVDSGGNAAFTMAASGAQSYQWYFNGTAIAGATNPTLTITNATVADSGTYVGVAKNASGSVSSSSVLLTVANVPTVSRLSNLSILTTITADDPLFTIGTVIGGGGTSGSKPVLVRAAGTALTVFGVGGVISDPKLDVFSGSTVVASNDNWAGTPGMNAAFASVGAFGYSPGSKDAAVYNAATPAGPYTVQITGVGGATGTVIAEIYDSTPGSQFTAYTPRLKNVSVRKQINAGDTLTAGFVITGGAPKQVLIRAAGPTLSAAPFNLDGMMPDPKLQLYAAQTVIANNDNWGTPVGSTAATATQLSTAFTQVGAFGLATGSKDAALLITLAPGNYSAQVTGVGNSAGQVVVEVYEMP